MRCSPPLLRAASSRFSTYADREATKSPRARRPGLWLRVCSLFGYCYELCSLPLAVCVTARAPRPATSRGHRRVQRAATVALTRLFVQSPCCRLGGPRQPHCKRRLCVPGRFGRGGWLFEALGFEATYQTMTCHPPPSPKPGRQSQRVVNSSFTASASVGTDSARRESYQQRSTTAKTQAQRRAATKVAS